MPFGVRKRLAESLVMHNFDYALLALCDINNEQLTGMQKAMNAVVRFIFRLNRCASHALLRTAGLA